MSLSKEIIDMIDLMHVNHDKAALKAFIEVESGGRAFDPGTGKIMIQFEPLWFSRKTGIQISHTNTFNWDENQVEVQSAEWKAFNEAFALNKNAAMESTSIGLPQIMGFHWSRLGYQSVGEMWDDLKTGIPAQIEALIKFIDTDANLLKAIKTKDWHMVASIYNGSGYKKLAEKLGREPYNISLRKAYEKYSA